MAQEALQRVRTGIGQIGFAALQKMAQMCCDAEVVGRDLGRVPRSFECVGKSVDVRPTQASSQADQDLGRAEVLFQHDVLLVVLAMYGRTTVAGERPTLWGAGEGSESGQTATQSGTCRTRPPGHA